MPPKKKRYTLTDNAERDFREAKKWSLARWNKKLTKQYFIDLHEGAEWIAANYTSLAEKEHLTQTTGLGIYAVREHYILYVPILPQFIIIVALIRQCRDVPKIIKENSFIFRRELKHVLGEFDDSLLPK